MKYIFNKTKLLRKNHQKKLDTLSVSVHWLTTGFMDEIKAIPNLDENSSIYDIENLNGPPGVIRNKGVNVKSPVDGKMGAAYVHCLGDDKDKVGPATFMLSYTWGYSIGDIVQTLHDYCSSNNLNPKQTYIWICCLCVNQHRVVENTKRGFKVPFDKFHSIFKNRVLDVGHILVLMSPWSNPLYRKRVWCVFEMFTACVHGCKVTIIMSNKEKRILTDAVLGNSSNGNNNNNEELINKLYEALNTNVENAEASVEDDKIKILQMIKNQVGCANLNNKVNELLRDWIHGVVLDIAERHALEDVDGKNKVNSNNKKPSGLLPFGRACDKIGDFLWRHQEYSNLDLFRTKSSSI